MKRAVLLLFGLFLFLLGGNLLAEQAPGAPPVHEIKMTAKKYEYNPNEIHVRQGERVRLLITALDRKHGFEIKDLGIKTELPEGKATAVEFVADKPGEYPFNCSSFCGFGHRRMKGKLVVEAATGER